VCEGEEEGRRKQKEEMKREEWIKFRKVKSKNDVCFPG
jgi:hypothetical protein